MTEVARDLSGWSVTEVARDRYPVEARQVRPWISEQRVDPEAYARAAHDVGAMLLSGELAAEFRHGVLTGSGRYGLPLG